MRSIPRCWARFKAAEVGITPAWLPSSAITRTCGASVLDPADDFAR
jgi:hypothetical protein